MNSDSSDFKKQTHFDDFYFHIFVLSSILTYLNKSDFQKYFRKSRKKPIINKIEHFKIKVMKTIKFSFFFKVVRLKLKIFCFLSLVLSSVCYSEDSEDMENKLQGEAQGRNPASKKDELTTDLIKLRNNLLKANLIQHENETGLDFFHKTFNSPVIRIFSEECDYMDFSSLEERYVSLHSSPKIDSFIDYINSFQLKSEAPTPEILKTLPEQIEKTIRDCIIKIYRKYTILSHKFAHKTNKAYYLETIEKNEKIISLIHRSFTGTVISLSLDAKSSENFKTIQKYMEDYIQFESTCRESISSLDGIWSRDDTCDDTCGGMWLMDFKDRYTKLKTKFNNLDQGFEGKRCKKWHKYFTNITNKKIFEKFIDLPETSCKSMENLKTSMNEDCKETANRLTPPSPTKENEDNLFYQCKTEIDQTYIKCFGEEGKRNDNQLTLYLIDQKSPAVCGENRLAKAQTAWQKCRQAVEQCRQNCRSIIDTFKTDFLQCFFLPDFNSYKILHRAKTNQCSDRIEKLDKKFIEQAKKEPFKIIENVSLHSLDHPNNSPHSTAYHIIGTCEDVLKERQIDKKLVEMQTECQQNPQQENQEQNHLIDTATANHNPSGSSGSRNPTSSYSKGGSETGSVPFSYESNNKGFDFNNNLQTEEEQKNSSADPYQMPSLDSNKPPSPNDESDKDSISADFESNGDNSKSSSPYSSAQSSSPRRSVSSTGYAPSLGADSLSADTANTTKERSETLGTNIRRFLSSDDQYGIINDSPYPQSASQRFLGWMNDKTRKAKKALLNTYDGIVGIDRAEFQRRLQLNNETVNLFELQKEMFIEVCKTHNCDGAGASPEIQAQIRQQQLKRTPSQ